MCKFSLDFTKTLRFISKNTMSKVILKYQVSMLTCPSVHPAYPKIHFRITRAANLLWQLKTKCRSSKLIAITFCKIIIDALGQSAHYFVSSFIINIEQIIV